jgi:hypothetical protein
VAKPQLISYAKRTGEKRETDKGETLQAAYSNILAE